MVSENEKKTNKNTVKTLLLIDVEWTPEFKFITQA
jgi:hypothetical protein